MAERVVEQRDASQPVAGQIRFDPDQILVVDVVGLGVEMCRVQARLQRPLLDGGAGALLKVEPGRIGPGRTQHRQRNRYEE